MTLAEKELPWQSYHLELRAGDQMICEYLDAAHPRSSLRSAPAAARADR